MTKFIDFNSLAAGTVVDNEFSAQGVNISAFGGSNQAMIFNTAHPTGGDNDLATTNLGGALIISEDGDSSDPDDNAGGGTIRFAFDEPSSVNRLTFLDIEEGAWVHFYDAHGNIIHQVDIAATADNGQVIIDFDIENVSFMDVTLGGSGAIDNLVFDTSFDGVVDGDNDANLIDAGFEGDPEGDRIDANDAILAGEVGDDDIVDALGGDDTVLAGAGNDEVFAGSGDDSVDGGAGDDLIFGDSNVDGATNTTSVRESFEWDQQGFASGEHVTGFTQNTGSVDVTFNIAGTQGTDIRTDFADNAQNVANIDADGAPVDSHSSLANQLVNEGSAVAYTLDFSEGVDDVSFRINDIDGGGAVTVQAYDADGNQITVNLEGGSELSLFDTDGVAGNDTADSNGGFLEDNTSEYSLLVSVPGPVSRLVIVHGQNEASPSGINITDVYFDAPIVDDGAPGNDTLDGGDGNDSIYGEDGNDDIDGGAGNDFLEGGDGDDRVFGGTGDDTVYGGEGNDTLGGSDLGNDLFIGGAGDDVVEASFGNDTIDGGTGNDDLWASADDDLVNGGDGNDVISGGQGQDTLFGDADNDTISGGSGDDVIDGGTGDDEIRGDGNFNDDTGPAGDDLIDGGAGDDTIRGEGGDDVITGGTGQNVLIGNTGDDTFIGGDGADSITGGAGLDIIDYSASDGPIVVDLAAMTATGGDAENDTLAGGVDGIIGTDFDDVLTGFDGFSTDPDDAFTNVLLGGAGNDTIDGAGGPDSLDGGDDADLILGGEGDVVDGGAGGNDFDTLDLTGQGLFVIEDLETDSNGNGFNGTIVFVNPDGSPTGGSLVFTEIEQIIGEEFNNAPDATDDTAEVDEDGSVDIPVLDNDTDEDGDALRVTDATSPDGTVTINPDGTLTFEPNENFNGPTTITYTVTDDNGGEDTATVDVTVNPVNDAPVANDDTATVDEDGSVDIPVLDNDTDVDGDALRVTDATSPDGEVTINPDGTLTFEPNENFNGPTTITYTVTDDNGGEDTATVDVNVTAGNDGPVANDDTAEVDEDGSVDIPVLDNDTDEDGDALRVTDATSPDGTVTINPDGTLTFEPNENFNGPTTITYTVTDDNGGEDTATVDVTVNPVNDAPDAVNDVATTPEDTPITIDALDNDTDVDGDTLTITGASVPSEQGTVEIVGNQLLFTPAENFNGDATISYSIEDGNGGTDTADVVVTVTPVNDDPVAVDDLADTMEDEPVVIDLIGNDTDVDGDPLTIGTVSVPSEQGEVVDNGDGTVTFTPAPNFNGTATIDYTVVDGQGGEDDGQAVVNVGAVNDGPDAVDDTATTDEDTPVTIDVLDNDSDPDSDPLTITGASVPADQGTVEIVGDALLFTPAENFNGDATITYSITDGNGGTDTADVAVTVTPVNDDPVAVDDIETTDEDTPVVVDLLGNDTDVDGDDLSIGSLDVDPAEGTVVDNGDGTVTFTPAPNFNGPATITYTVIDGNGGEDTGEAVVSVGAVNDGPVANDDTATTDEDTPVTVDVIDNDTDDDGDALTITSATVPADQGTVEIVGNELLFTPAENFNGEATVTYTITDGNGGNDVADLVVTVNPVNDAPDAVDDAETTPFNTAVTIPVLDNDTDVDGDDLRVIEATSPDGDVAINGDGTLTFTPTDGFEGEATIDYTITDDNGGEDSAVVTVTVEENPLDGIVEGTDDGELIDDAFDGDPEGDMVDNGDNIFSDDPEDEDDDIIEAGGGNDTVIAGQGDDVVDGGSGDDLIDTGNGDIAPDLGFPNDDGTPAPSFPFGFPADDDPDNDLDFVDGGTGDDTISTGDDADTIIGGDGNDVIDGGIDDDVIEGDDSTDPTAGGNDRIVGGEGNDLIDGGDGDDTIFAGNDPVLGLDELNIEDDGSNPIFPADPRPDNGMDTVFGGDGNDVIFGADDDDELFGEEGNDTIDGEIDDDFIDGGIGDDSLLGGQGNDTIEGGEGNDVIDAGGQADTVDGGEGNDTIIGGNGADVLSGGAGDDVIDGGTGDDTLNGDAGDDSILGSTGDDVIDGGAGNDTIDGGNGGSDIMSGGDDSDLFINVDAGEQVDGGGGGDDFDTLDLRGSAPNNGSLQVVFTNPDANGNGFDGVVNYFDENGDPAGQLTFTDIEDVIPCFTPGTMIATPTGERRVEDLKSGDRVITRDNGIQEIRWVGHRAMTGEELARAEHLRPVLIQKGALGNGLPERDMLVSPQHRVLMASDKTALYFDESEVLVAAKHLTGMDGIDVVEVSGTTYIHVMFDQHEVILSDGAWTESFQPGDMTLGAMGDAQRAEILELFPELETADGMEAYTAARRSLKKHEAQLLTQ